MAEDPDQRSAPARRLGEIAALVSALAAVAGILLAVFGVPGFPGATAARPGAPSTASAAPPPSATTAAAVPSPSLPALPRGWRRVAEPELTAVFAVPDGWTRTKKNAIQSAWASPGGTYEIVLKRDTSYGPTARAAAAGQLAWYREEAESSMAALRATTRAFRQGGKEGVRLDLGYHWRGQSAARSRVEVFVAGEAGRVYQILVDTPAGGEHLARQRELLETAVACLVPDAE
ncbi:hypothetical protein PV682_24865 [Streptomyces niveiscabiei]|uniref:hypothetical protein n=1 Tax=Streptomyces niveiscabiei TaxID=164115 RepID=UPI0029B6174F|nr:hypothetical protein [Streptomyces niveiscabiei]MDX3384674.1 hypothetical protein [Streptomyces niveiscabiei]